MPSLIFDVATKKQLDELSTELPQSILLTGESGVGLFSAASYIAGSQLAGIVQPTDKDGKISANGIIRLDEIQQLRCDTRGRTTKRTVFIIDDADSMNHRAQNAFLKLLEEPSPRVHFILTSHHPQQLLPTINSRVARFLIRPISTTQSQRLVSQLHVDSQRTQQQILFLADGRPAEISRLASKPNELEKITRTIHDAQNFVRGSSYQRLAIIPRYNNRDLALELLKYCLTITRHATTQNPQRELILFMQRIAQTYETIQTNGNGRLQLTALAL